MTGENGPVRFGMIGGGNGAFIGAVHRAAMRLDGLCTLIAGALSSSPERSLASAEVLGLQRGYESWGAMLDGESALPAGERVEAVSIVTPNHLHAEQAVACLDAGFHVVLDKPVATTVGDCKAIRDAAARSGRTVTVTYNYSGYPLVREARALVSSGAIGTVRRVQVEYLQGWLAGDLESTGHKQARWRTDPDLAGAGALGDIGTHAEHLAAFVTGLRPTHVLADVASHVERRRVDDDCCVLLRYGNGARGTLTVSQVCIGEENGLTLRVYGERGSLAWRQERPNALEHFTMDGERRVITRGSAASPAAADATRLPPGHPEGFHEAFANIYRGAADRVRGEHSSHELIAPTITDGTQGVAFVEACLASGGTWTELG
ncbi:MAG: Gfo/Idh/MocA family oxidoreductase [Planctomycetota bacterium]